MSESEGAGAAPSERLLGYDLARAFAIIGMVLINFPIFLAQTESATALAWISNVHYGRAAALFVTLAGAGVALMSRGAKPWIVRRTLLVRALFLILLGSALLLMWPIDILHFYAFYLTLAAIFLVTAPRWTLPWAAALVVAVNLGLHIAWPDIGDMLEVSTEFPRQGELAPTYWSPLGLLQNVFISGIHPVLPWFAFVIMGVWIGRHDLTDPATRGRLMALGAALGVGAPLLSLLLEQAPVYGLLPVEVLYYLGVVHEPSPLYTLGAVGTSMFMIALCQAVVARWENARIVRALVHAGQMALTIYLLHALVGVVAPQHFLGWSSLPLTWVLLYSLAFCAVAVVLAHLYRLAVKRGPVEMVMRAISGRTPEKVDARELARMPPAPRWWPAPAGAALAALIAFQFVGAPPNVACGERTIEQGRNLASLSLLCPSQAFSMVVADRGDIALETHTSGDMVLELYRGDELIGQNDDGGFGLNALLSMTLEPGTYRVVARPYESVIGPLTITRRDTAPTMPELAEGQICTEACASAHDNECDDGGPDSLYAICAFGSDCSDCGVRTLENKPEEDANMTPAPDPSSE
jgi:uncharacterized membrane protein YeiB